MSETWYPEKRNAWPVERIKVVGVGPLDDSDNTPWSSGGASGRVITGVTICNDGTDEVVDIIVQ